MGTGSSKNLASISDGGENREDQGGSMLYVSLKIEDFKLKFKTDLIPHVFGSAPLAGSWDSSKAVIPINSCFVYLTAFRYVLHYPVYSIHV